MRIFVESPKDKDMDTTIKFPSNLPSDFVRLLLSMSDRMKLYVIKLLTDSMLKSEKDATDDKNYTERMLKKHAGSWKGEESTDDLMNKIRENSSTREPLIF